MLVSQMLPCSPPSPLVTAKRPPELLQPPNPAESDQDDPQALLPRHCLVRIVGNARTKGSLLGQRAIVRRAVGLGGWHWLVLSTGEEVKLQRNALQVLEYPTGNEPDFSEDEDEEEQRRQQQQRQQAMQASSVEQLDKPRQRRPPRPAIEDAGVRRLSQRGAGAPRINLHKLDTAALKRYRAFYDLADAGPNPTKDDLVHSVEEHFTAQEVDEQEVIDCFLRAAKRHNMGLLTSW